MYTFSLHPSEEHDLVAQTVTRKVLDRRGQTVGQHAQILPGTLEEREALALIDHARHDATSPPLRGHEARRRLRRHWRDERP